MDFKSFKKSHTNDSSQPSSDGKDTLRKTAEEYGKKSDSELLKDIAEMANRGRENGTLSDESLQQFATKLSPMLNAEQRARLESVMKMLGKN